MTDKYVRQILRYLIGDGAPRVSANSAGNLFERLEALLITSVDNDTNYDTVLADIKTKTDKLPADTALALNTIIGYIDTEIAAIKTKTDNLPTNTATELSTIIGYIDTEVAAIKTKTDNLPVDTATVLNTISGYIDTEVGTIKAKTDNLPTDTASVLNTIISYIDTEVAAIKTKTDNLPTSTTDELTSILIESTSVEHHFHNKERWYGKKTGNNETNAIDNILTPFRITSGTGGYGTGVCIMGTGDVPVTGKTKFDVHRILCSNFQKQELAKLRIAWGTDTEAAAVTAGNYSTVMVNPQQLSRETEIDIRMPVLDNGTKVWANFWSVTNSQYVDLFIGVHGY